MLKIKPLANIPPILVWFGSCKASTDGYPVTFKKVQDSLRLLLHQTSSPAWCKIGIDKETWLERKTKDAFGLVELCDGIEFKDLVVGNGSKAMKGQVVGVRLYYSATAGGRKTEKWWSLNFILGENYVSVPTGVHLGIEGMRVHGRRLLLLSPEMLDSKYNSSMFVEVELTSISEANSLSEFELKTLGYGPFNRVLIALGLREAVEWIKCSILGVHYETYHEWKERAQAEVVPAETEEEFFDEKTTTQETKR